MSCVIRPQDGAARDVMPDFTPELPAIDTFDSHRGRCTGATTPGKAVKSLCNSSDKTHTPICEKANAPLSGSPNGRTHPREDSGVATVGGIIKSPAANGPDGHQASGSFAITFDDIDPKYMLLRGSVKVKRGSGTLDALVLVPAGQQQRSAGQQVGRNSIRTGCPIERGRGEQGEKYRDEISVLAFEL